MNDNRTELPGNTERRKPINQAHPIRRPFLNRTGRAVAAVGAAAATLIAANQAGLNPLGNPDNSQTVPAQANVAEGNVPNPLEHISLPPKIEQPESLKGLREIYTGKYEVSKGVTIRDGRDVLNSSDEINPGTGVPLDWDKIQSIEDVDISNTDKFVAENVEVYYGYNPDTGSQGDGLWMGFNTTLKNGEKQKLFISISPQTHDFIKALETSEKSFFLPMNSDGQSVTDPITKKTMTSETFNQITIPSNP